MPDVISAADRIAIEARDLGICYRRYRRRMLTLKEAAVNLFRGNSFENYWALRNVNLAVRRGESLGIVGPNGSGKSTLLKAIAGILPPSEGTLVAHGRIAPLINLGAGFDPELTGRENILLNGAIMGIPPKQMEQRIDRIIDFADIGDFIDSQLNTYSSGMKARLGFAVVSDVDADIMLLDEIFSVGDEEFRDKASARTEEFFKSDRTVVLVSHSLDLVTRLCDRAVCISGGVIVDEGEPERVAENYRSQVSRKRHVTGAS